jgi:nucleotide-binding universal stress UspA family protein
MLFTAVHGTPASERAVDRSIALARARGMCDLVFCHVIDLPRMLVRSDHFDDCTLDLDIAERAARRMMQPYLERARQAGLFARAYLRHGDPADELAAVAGALRASLLVAGNRGASKLERLLGGSVRDRLVRQATVPLLLAGDPAPTAGAERVLAIASDARTAERAFALADDLAGRGKARCVLVPAAHGSHAAATIAQTVRDVGPDTVVIAGSWRRGVADGLYADPVERLLRDAHRAVIVLPNAQAVTTTASAAHVVTA